MKRGQGCYLQGKLRQKEKEPSDCFTQHACATGYSRGPITAQNLAHCAPLREPHVSRVGSIEPLGVCPEAGPLRLSEAWVCPRVTPGEGVAGNKGPIQFWVVGDGAGQAQAGGPGGGCWETDRHLESDRRGPPDPKAHTGSPSSGPGTGLPKHCRSCGTLAQPQPFV